ncbi:MAG: hypothetical protein AB7F64_03475 [Gammaproteobacteria bacterium]
MTKILKENIIFRYLFGDKSAGKKQKEQVTPAPVTTTTSDPVTVLTNAAKELDALETKLKSLATVTDQQKKMQEIQAIKMGSNKIISSLDGLANQVSGRTADIKKYLNGRTYYLLSISWDLSVRYLQSDVRNHIEVYLSGKAVDPSTYTAGESRFAQGESGEKAQSYRERADGYGFNPITLTTTAAEYVTHQLGDVHRPH